MKTLLKLYSQKKKAIWAFILSFVGSLVAQIQSGTSFDLKTTLLALGVALVTGGVTHQVTNQEN